MRALAAPREQRLESFVVNVEPASIGAEGRHHSAAAVGDQTAPAFSRDTRDRMQMSRNLAGLRAGARLVPQMQWANVERWQTLAPDVGGNVWIVIAGNPDPLAPRLQRGKRGMIRRGHALRSAIVVKAVAERDDASRRPARDERSQTRQRRRRIVR